MRACQRRCVLQFGQELVNTWVTYLMRYEAAQEDYKRAQSDLQAQQNKGLCTLREMVSAIDKLHTCEGSSRAQFAASCTIAV